MPSNSAGVNRMVRWGLSSSFKRSQSSGAISATTFRWAWVNLTGTCSGASDIFSPLTRVFGQALPQDVQQVDQELLRPVFPDQLGTGPDPGLVPDQPRECSDASLEWVDEDALDRRRR